MSDPVTASVLCDAVLVLTVNVAEVRGEALTSELERAFAAEVDRTGATRVVVDLAAVRYITSSGVRTLLALRHRVGARGGRVVLCGLSEMVSEVLHLLRFIDATGRRPAPFDVRPDVAAATASLPGPAPSPVGG